jgi:hypothetical protein
MTCKVPRYSPGFYVDRLTPYTDFYETVQGMLFWRRPIPMGITLVLVEVIACFLYSNETGFLGAFAILASAYVLGRFLRVAFGDQVRDALFPPIDKGQPGESNRIYPLLPFCQRISHISSTVVDKIVSVHEGNQAGSVASLTLTTLTFFGLFAISWLLGTFAIVLILVHLVLLAPGAVMHPKVFPYAEPYILKFAEAIHCPYCHAKAE